MLSLILVLVLFICITVLAIWLTVWSVNVESNLIAVVGVVLILVGVIFSLITLERVLSYNSNIIGSKLVTPVNLQVIKTKEKVTIISDGYKTFDYSELKYYTCDTNDLYIQIDIQRNSNEIVNGYIITGSVKEK